MMTDSDRLLTIPRLTTLLTSLLVTLSSGTNYVYSAYSPQLGARLGITHTQLNIVASTGNLGVYVTGPILGKIVDTRGPRSLLASAFASLLTGYLGIRYFYDSGLPEGVTYLSTASFILLAFCSFLTGAGGSGGLTSSVNTTAKSFPDKSRASATGLVISGFGLSAFLYSTIAHVFFPGDTSSFLLVLALGTSVPMFVGFFFMRPIPPPQEKLDRDNTDEEEVLTTLLHHHNTDDANQPHLLHHETSADSLTARENDTLPNLYGIKLFRSLDFWLLGSILAILSGTGLMYINNVGSMSQTLYAHETAADDYDPSVAARWQAAQVSTISVTNFLGRILIGLLSDYTKHAHNLPRSYCLILVALVFFLSQLVAIGISTISSLWIASLLLGLAYGSMFSLFPTLCLESFGISHFSENWGFLCLSPIISGNIFSLIFGLNLDRHSKPDSPIASDIRSPFANASSPTSDSDRPLCLSGSQCYVSSIYMTAFATFVAILLSVYATHRERKREVVRPSIGMGRRDEDESVPRYE